MFTQIIKFLRLLGSETEPSQISMGFAFALFFGFTPFLGIHTLIILFFLLVLRVNIAACVFASLLFAGLSYLLDPIFIGLGEAILNLPALSSTFTEMYNSSWWRVTRFNNTLLMGSFALSVALFIPVLLVSNLLIRQYRSRVISMVKSSRWYRFLQNSKWFARAIKMAE